MKCEPVGTKRAQRATACESRRGKRYSTRDRARPDALAAVPRTRRLAFHSSVKDAVSIPVIANGDIVTLEDVAACLAQSGADGVMIGRGAYGRPWIVGQAIHFLATGEKAPEPALEAQRGIVLEHFEAMLEHHGECRGTRDFRKHVTWYSNGLPDSATFRDKVYRLEEPAVVRRQIADFYDMSIETAAA